MKKSIIYLICLFAVNAYGQAPEGVNYQAVVRDAAGLVLSNTNVGMKLTMHETTASGTIVYDESFTVATNAFGLVNLVLGQGTIISGDFSMIDWAGDAHFLEVSADVSGGTSYSTLGTQQLMSVPYALHAKTSDDSYSGDYNDLINQPAIPTNTSDLINDSGFITSPDDADADPLNEIQTLSISGDQISLSLGGGTITQQEPVLENTGTRSNICSGNTAAGVGWTVYSPNAITITISTSGCGFTSNARYFTSLGGVGSHYTLVGPSAIYSPGLSSFTIYVQKADGTLLTPADATAGGWFINWTSVGD